MKGQEGRVTFMCMLLAMRGCPIITKVRQGEFTWPISHQLFTSISHMDFVSPDSSKKIKDVLAEFNESGSLKEYDSHEVRKFPFQAFKNSIIQLSIICSTLGSLAHVDELVSQHIFFCLK